MNLDTLIERDDIPEDAKEIIRKGIILLKEKEDKIYESESKYRELVERADIGIIIIQEGRIKFTNKVIADMGNFNLDDVMGMPFINFIHPKSLPEFKRRYEKRMAGEEISDEYETTLITKEGKSIDIEIKAGLITFDKRPADLILVKNVTEKNQVLRELRESETRYRTLITTALEGCWITDLDHNTIYVNPALEKMLGWTLEEMKGKSVREYLNPESLEIFNEKSVERYEDGIPSSSYNLTYKNKDGVDIITRVAGTALYNSEKEIIGSFGLITDITSEKLAQERYHSLIEFNPDAIILTDLKFNIIALNKQTVILTGAKNEEELIGRNAFSFIPLKDRERALTNTTKTLNEGSRFTFEYDLVKLDNTTFPAELIVSRVDDTKGNPTSFIGILRDITNRKKNEQKIIESERKYRTLVENINSGIFRVSAEGDILQCNRAFLEMFGYDSIDEMNQYNLSNLYVNENDRTIFIDELYEKGEINIREILMKRKEGDLFWASISSRLTPDKRHHDGIVEDISERKVAEETLRQVKLEEERYHAMLSHFVRNDLQKIVNNLDYILLEFQSKKTLSTSDIRGITTIAKRSSRTIDLVNQIFEVLQTPFDPEAITQQTPVANIITDICSSSRFFQRPFDVKTENLNFLISDDKYLREAFFEIIRFLADQDGKGMISDSPITIDGACFNSRICFIIRDSISTPIPLEVCTRLSAKITEEWEYRGHYIGITLASVITQHYMGEFKIYPSEKKGNEFQLWFPENFLLSKIE